MKRIVCFGDSNTWGYTPGTGLRLEEDKRWTGILQKELGEGYRVVEEGLNGRNTVFEEAGFLCGIRDVVSCLMTNKPIDLVVLMLGTNDLRFTDANGAVNGVRRIVEEMQRAVREEWSSSPVFTSDPMRILLVSPIHAHPVLNTREPGDYHIGYPEKSLQFAPLYRALAQEAGCGFVDAALYAQPSEIDGMHIRPEDHPALAKAIAQGVREMLEK